jgi:hypothetical protein
VPLTVNGSKTDSHWPVSLPLRIVLRLSQDIFKARSLRLNSLFAALQSLSSALTFRMTLRWSVDRKTSMPRNAAKMWEHRRMLASKFGCAEVVGSGIVSPAHLTGRPATARRGSSSSYSSPKRVGRKVLGRVCSMDANSGPIPFVTRYTNCHSCCKDFCKPE